MKKVSAFLAALALNISLAQTLIPTHQLEPLDRQTLSKGGTLLRTLLQKFNGLDLDSY